MCAGKMTLCAEMNFLIKYISIPIFEIASALDSRDPSVLSKDKTVCQKYPETVLVQISNKRGCLYGSGRLQPVLAGSRSGHWWPDPDPGYKINSTVTSS
jgi:hypothetical protein